MALGPQDKRGQLLLIFTIVALGILYFTFAGATFVGVNGIGQLGRTRDSLQNQIDSLQRQVDAANRTVRQGAVARLERALAEYRATLDQMRTLVPAGEEMPNLLDDISSRAKARGATIVNYVPAPLESGAPFDTKRVRVQVTGQYDQIGEYLSDIASLPRIIVPYDLHIERVQAPGGQAPQTAADSARSRLLTASFNLRTFVKPVVIDTTTAAPAAPAPGGGQ
jgi:Tfp pilus assembly protein PilO